MNVATDLGSLLVNSIGTLVILVFFLRFLLQLVRADFYNPISQFVVKASNPILIPLRRIIPGYGGLDIASLLLTLIAQVLVIAATYIVNGQLNLPWLTILALSPFKLMLLVLDIYFWGLIIVVIASWVAPNSYNPALILINQILEPVMRPIRRWMPDLGGIDISPIVVFLAIQAAEIVVSAVGSSVLAAI